jgi:hypothetical protein
MTSKLTQLTENKPENAEFLSRNAFNWMKRQIQYLRNPAQMIRGIKNERHRYVNKNNLGINTNFLIGGLYFFAYNPKLKDDLPYYDAFPLVIPLQRYPDGFLGLNLHYLPIQYRLIFLNKLKNFAIYNDEDEIKRFRVTYDILNESRRLREFRPCVKRYLNNHIKSRVLSVAHDEWDVALYLPVHQFRKENASTVWQESVETIRNS